MSVGERFYFGARPPMAAMAAARLPLALDVSPVLSRVSPSVTALCMFSGDVVTLVTTTESIRLSWTPCSALGLLHWAVLVVARARFRCLGLCSSVVRLNRSVVGIFCEGLSSGWNILCHTAFGSTFAVGPVRVR